jgi:hypothetical protein
MLRYGVRRAARLSLHLGFTDPDAPADATPRQSIEVRTIAFFEN